MTASECHLIVKLVPFISEHIGQTFHWLQTSELRRLFLLREEVTWEKHQSYFSRVLADPAQRVYAIIAGKQHVGNCGFKNMKSKEGELWIYIGVPSMSGKGIGGKATSLLIQEGFKMLGLDMIYVHVADFNAYALRMYRKLEFIETTLKDNADEWMSRGCTIIRMELEKKEK